MKTILLPTDHSEHSKNAIRYALDLFRNTDQRFLLMNAYYMPHAGAVMMTSIEELLRKSSMEDMDKLVNELSAAFPDIADRIDQSVVYGDPFIAIRNTLKKRNDIELVVMGTTGASGLKAVMIGSVTAQMVKNIPCSVLAVPHDAEYSSPKNIALAADQLDAENVALGPLLNIARSHGSKVHVFKVELEATSVEGSAQIAGSMDVMEGVENSTYIEYGEDLESGILKFINDHSCEMLAMVHHRYGTIEQLFHKSASKQLVLHTHVPLLVLRDKA